MPSECQISFFQTTQNIGITPERKTINPFIVIELIGDCYLSCTHLCKRSMCLSCYFLSNPRSFSILLSPISLIYHQWIPCNPFTSSLLIVMHKIRCKTTIFWSIFTTVEVLLPRNCHQFGSKKLINSYMFGHFLHYTSVSASLFHMSWPTGLSKYHLLCFKEISFLLLTEMSSCAFCQCP